MARADASGAEGFAGSSAVNGGEGAVAQPANTPKAISVMRYRFMVSLPSLKEGGYGSCLSTDRSRSDCFSCASIDPLLANRLQNLALW
jgi:hypothetical protein